MRLAQFWLATHPPARGRGSRYIGTHPAVHTGFLCSWLCNGLDARVLQRIEEILQQGDGKSSAAPRQILLTGVPQPFKL